ncbi:hypothetical protein ACF0H5_019260 [Mactra antiquata]
MSCVTSSGDSNYKLVLESSPSDLLAVETRSRKSRNSLSENNRYPSVHQLPKNGYLTYFDKIPPRTGRLNKLPWFCECELNWKDLGNDHKPRFVRDGKCSKNKCWYGHYDCIPQRYNIQVLRRIRPNNPFEYNTRVADYAFTQVNVTVGCVCGRA